MKTIIPLLALLLAASAVTGQPDGCPLPLPQGIQLNPDIATGRFIGTGYFDEETFADTRLKAGRFLSRDERAQYAAWDNAVWLNNDRIAAWRGQQDKDTLPSWLRERLPEKYRKSRSGAFAILDADGRELTPPRYDEIVFFAALAAGAPIPVRVGARWGYLNDRGEEIIAPQFEQPGLFYDGIARVKRDGAYAYIDRKGQPAAAPGTVRPRIPAAFRPIRLNKPGEYSEGLASFERATATKKAKESSRHNSMRQATFMTDWRRSASADSRRATSGATAHTSAHRMAAAAWASRMARWSASPTAKTNSGD